MRCTHIQAPGLSAIVCTTSSGSRYCVKCGQEAARLCDWKVGLGRTCDRPICDACTSSPAPDKDLCPTHAKTWAAHPSNQQPSLPLGKPAATAESNQ
jgi:hypothetical protein